MEARLAALDEAIAAYAADLEANDRAEAQPETAALRERQAATAADLARLEASGDGQLSRTDPDARLLAKRGQVVAGYNVQIAVDDKHKLIVAGAVENDGNDTGQPHALASAAKAALGSETLQAVADACYFNGETIRACETDGIAPFVPQPARSRAAADGRHGPEAFVYDAQGRRLQLSHRQAAEADEGPQARCDRQAAHRLRQPMLCYNLTRVLNILGLKRWLAVMAEITPAIISTLLRCLLDSPATREHRTMMSPTFATRT